MRDVDLAMQQALAMAVDTGLEPRRAVWFKARDRNTGAAAEAGFWTGDEDINLSVYSGFDGSLVTRPYTSSGALLSVSDIPRVSDFTVQTVTVTISQIADAAQQLFRQYDLRLAKVEIHELLIDPKTGNQVSPGAIVFLGETDGAPVKTPARGGAGSVPIKVVSDVMSMLTRKNPRKSSFEGQKTRNNDQWGKDGSVVATWKIPWGQTA